MQNNDYIDVALEWLEQRKCSYLAKEDAVVYYMTPTGRESDYQWVHLSLAEVTRVIQATKLRPNHTLTRQHVMCALQEMGRVFEFGVKTRHKVSQGILNYLTEAVQDMGDIIMRMCADELFQRGFLAFRMEEATELFNLTKRILGVDNISEKSRVELMHKHYPAVGYEIRVDKYRPLIDGRKQSCIMMPGTKPRDVVHVGEAVITAAAKKIYGALR